MAQGSLRSFRRYEKKLLIDAAIVASLQEDLSVYMSPDEYNAGGEPYVVCNLYFDNARDDVIRESVAKPRYKEKLRLRSYGVPNDDTKVFLEIKRKVDGVGVKRRAKLKLSQIDEYLATGKHPESLSYMDEQVLREVDYYLSHTPVAPRVYVSYLRHAYFAKDDPSFRVTFDSGILTRRYDLDLRKGRYGEPLLPEGKILLEVKFSGAVPLWFARLFGKYHLSFGTYSKVGNDFKKEIARRVQNAARQEPLETFEQRKEGSL